MKNLNLFLFIIIISISITFCELCGLNPPQNEAYCNINNHKKEDGEKCCYCKNTQKEEYFYFVGDMGPPYSCNCNIQVEDPNLPGSKCDRQDELDKLESEGKLNVTICHEHSIDKHPCCYYDDGIEQTCFSIGKITSDTLYTYSDFVDCFSFYQRSNILFTLIFIILSLV